MEKNADAKCVVNTFLHHNGMIFGLSGENVASCVEFMLKNKLVAYPFEISYVKSRRNNPDLQILASYGFFSEKPLVQNRLLMKTPRIERELDGFKKVSSLGQI